MTQTEYFGLYVQATPPAPTLTGSELVPVVIAGVTNNTTTANIAALAAPTTNWNRTRVNADFGPVPIYTAPPLTNTLVNIQSAGYTRATDASAGVVQVELAWTDPATGPQTQSMSIDLATPSSSGLTPGGGVPGQIAIAGGTSITLTGTISGSYGLATYDIMGTTVQLNEIH